MGHMTDTVCPMHQVYVLKIQKGNKVALTQKTPEQRQAEETMAKSGAGTSKRKATHTLEAALAAVGFKATPKPKVCHKLALLQK